MLHDATCDMLYGTYLCGTAAQREEIRSVVVYSLLPVMVRVIAHVPQCVILLHVRL